MDFRKMLINNARKAMLDNITALDKKTLQRELESHLKLEFEYRDEIERLNNIIEELEKDIEEYFKKEYPDRKLENYNLKNCTYDYALVILGKLKELKGSDNNDN